MLDCVVEHDDDGSDVDISLRSMQVLELKEAYSFSWSATIGALLGLNQLFIRCLYSHLILKNQKSCLFAFICMKSQVFYHSYSDFVCI